MTPQPFTAARIAIAFLAFGVGWILLSDRLLEALVTDHGARAVIQSVKGLVFVLVSAALVYALSRAAERRHAALEALAAHERDRLALVLEVNPAVVYSLRMATDGSGGMKVDFVGPNVVKVTGYPAEQWLSHPDLWLSHVHPDDVAAALAKQQELLDTGETSHEYRFQHADGSYRWIHDQLVLVRAASGEPTHIMGAWLDVSDRKQAESSSLASEARYRLMFQANPMPMFLVDNASRRFLAVNNAAMHTYGYSEEEFLQLTLNDIRPPHEVARMQNTLAQLETNGKHPTHLGDWLHKRRDGTEFWVEVIRHAVVYQGRACQLALPVDVSVRKQAEAHRSLIAGVFEASQQGILITDAATRFISVNQAFTRITGYTEEDVKGQTPRLLNSKRQNKAFYQAMWAAIETEGRWEGEIWNRSKSGDIYPEWLVISTIKDADGQVRYYLGMFTETSSRKEAEARILRLVNYDNLTNLPNRALLFNHAQK